MTMTKTACNTPAMRGITVAAIAAALTATAATGSAAAPSAQKLGEVGGVEYDLAVTKSCAHVDFALSAPTHSFHWVVAGRDPHWGDEAESSMRFEGYLVKSYADHDAAVSVEFPRFSGVYDWRVVINGDVVRRVHVATDCA